MRNMNVASAIDLSCVIILTFLIAWAMTACETMPTNKQTQEQKTEIAPELTIETQGDVQTEVITENTTSQDQVASSGAVVDAKNVDKIETETINNEGEKWWVWLLVGFLIPMPRFIRWFF